ncbi:MAG: nucleotidyltransferase domain-containing protein [Deltaproteobacteria bacterium]|nr:nucleotidyltransferase domain-containing protein [Deltaproteobacteria bacterium]
MVKSRDQIIQVVRCYLASLANDFRITQAYLFGSYAQGTAREESDIDVALVSEDFRDKSEMELLGYLSQKTIPVHTGLEVLAFTPEELEQPDPRTLSYQVKTFGVPLVP